MYILNFQTMIEIPESQTVARQVRETLAGRTVTGVFNATHPHKFIWYTGDPLEYPMLLTGRKIVGAEGCGAFVDVLLENDMHLALSDGVILRLYGCEDPIPAKYQLLVTLDDGSFLVCTVADEMFTAGGAVRRRLFQPALGRVEAESLGKGIPGHGTTDSGARERSFAGYSVPGGDSPNANSPRWGMPMRSGFSGC